MADNLLVPVTLDRILDSNGDPVNGAKVHVYNAGTTTAVTNGLWTDIALTSAGANPMVADSGGYLATRYVGTGSYKLLITTSADVTIKTEDNLPGALDTSGFDSDQGTAITPVITKSTTYSVVDADQGKVILCDSTGGSFTITLPSAVTVADNWRVTIKHTGTGSGAVTVAAAGAQTIDGAASQVLNYQYESITVVSDGANFHISEDGRTNKPELSITPQGRLTLTSGTPVLSSDVSSGTSVYYMPYEGNLCPIYDGQRMVPRSFSELTLTGATQHTASGIFDVFIINDSSAGVVVATGPAWTTATAGSGARGTGAGTTELEYKDGLLTNKVSMTARNGSTTYTVAVNEGTYVGSVFVDSVAGQFTCNVTYGQSRKWAVWNAYNRKPIILKAGDATASWTYTTATFRAANGDSTNSLTVFTGLAEEIFDVRSAQVVSNSGTAVLWSNGIGWNSTSTISGFGGGISSSAAGAKISLHAAYIQVPDLGVNVVTMLEKSAAAGTTTWYGGEDDNLIIADWLG